MVTDVNGELKLFSLRSNLKERRELKNLARKMLDQYFRGQKNGKFIVAPWPA